MAAVRHNVISVTNTPPDLGVAEGLFCAEAALNAGCIVPAGDGDRFRRSLPIEALERTDVATTCRRLGISTVGLFADLPPARVAERFPVAVRQVHLVARGELSELPHQRDRRLATQLRRARGDEEITEEQLGFFGQRSAADDRASVVAHRVRQRLGPDAVVVARVRGGRSPDDRAVLVPWGAPESRGADTAPWPGRLCGPAPTTTFRRPVAIYLRDATGLPLVVGARGSLSATPQTVDFGRGQTRAVAWYAGPWPLVEQWWATPRRRAQLQIVTEGGEAYLLSFENAQWWLVGVYD